MLYAGKRSWQSLPAGLFGLKVAIAVERPTIRSMISNGDVVAFLIEQGLIAFGKWLRVIFLPVYPWNLHKELSCLLYISHELSCFLSDNRR